jgi:hypothetical protein
MLAKPNKRTLRQHVDTRAAIASVRQSPQQSSQDSCVNL